MNMKTTISILIQYPPTSVQVIYYYNAVDFLADVGGV